MKVGAVRYSPHPLSAQALTSLRKASRLRRLVSTSVITGKPIRNTQVLSQLAWGTGMMALRGIPTSLAAANSTSWASSTASPVRGMIGENQTWPVVGLGLNGVRAPIEKIDRLGIPKTTLWTFSCCSGVSGSL